MVRGDTYKFAQTDDVMNALLNHDNSNLRSRKEYRGKRNETALDLARRKLASLINQYETL